MTYSQKNKVPVYTIDVFLLLFLKKRLLMFVLSMANFSVKEQQLFSD